MIAAHTAGITAIIILSGYTPQATDVGNILQITGGTGFIAGFYQITAINAGSLTWTLDRNATSGAATGMIGGMGGALKTPTALSAATALSPSNKAFLKAESIYQTAATLSFTPGNVTPGTAAPYTRLIGYTTARGDGGMFTIKLITNAALTGLLLNSNGMQLENISIDCNSLTTSTGIDLEGGSNIVLNCKVANFKLRGIWADGNNNLVFGSEVTGGITGATAAIDVGASLASKVEYCNIHDNACPGLRISQPGTSAGWNLITNNTGAASDGILATGSTSSGLVLQNNTIYGSGQNGINLANSSILAQLIVRNNILASNAGWGISLTSGAGTPASPMWDGNAYWNNTSGTRHNLDDIATNPVNGVSPYTNVLDVVVTVGTPFTNAAGGDFTLNATANQGALLRGNGTPGAIPGVSQVGYVDFGCFQHQDPAGGAGGGKILASSIIQGIGAL